MPPAPKQSGPPFKASEKVFCFHMDHLYEARVLDVQPLEAGDGWQYKIHYKGWKNTWDDWVPQDRVRKFNDETKDLATQLRDQAKNQQAKGAPKMKKGPGGRANGSDFSSARGSEERTAVAAQPTATGRGPRRIRDYDLENEENFQNRPSIKLHMPDQMKAFLVDDWENVTKNHQLVPLPHPHPLDEIIKDYVASQRPHFLEESPERDILDETMAGLREYFNKALGRVLLYKFERPQYNEQYWQWEGGESEHKCAADTYGAEHLLRLLVSLPELVAQTNMDKQSVDKLRMEMMKFTNWISKNTKYFVPEYVSPGQDYQEKSRNS